jgi:hypothetical protein
MRISTLELENLPAYDEFLLSHSGSLLYASSRYMNLLLELLGCKQETLLAWRDDGALVGALPLMSTDGPWGRVFNSLPYYGSNGGLISTDDVACAALTDAYNKLVSARGTAAATVIENPLIEKGCVGLRHEITDERIGQLTPIDFGSSHADALMSSFHYKTRNMIRKSEKLGVSVAVENARMDFLSSVHEENMREIGGLAKSRQFFTLVLRHFRPEVDYRIYVARLGGEPVAAMLIFFFNRTVEYYTPVVRKEFRDSQALSAVIFRAMCDASREGYVFWNWGGTWLSQEGVYRFKSRWGTRDIVYRYYTTICNPQLQSASRAELLAGYPSFYTVPFSMLQA